MKRVPIEDLLPTYSASIGILTIGSYYEHPLISVNFLTSFSLNSLFCLSVARLRIITRCSQSVESVCWHETGHLPVAAYGKQHGGKLHTVE